MKDNRGEGLLDDVIYMLTAFSKGNFSARKEVTADDDPINMVISGLNMLGEELSYYKHEIDDQRAFLQNILSSIDEVIYVRNVQQHLPLYSPYSFISIRSEEIIGYTPEQLRSEPDKWVRSVHPEDQEKCREVLISVMNGHEAAATYRIYHPGRQQFVWIEDRILPKKDSKGTVTHLYGSARDVNEQQNINIELEEKSKLFSRVISSSDQVFYIIELDPEDPVKNTFTYLSTQVEKVIGSTVEEVRQNPYLWVQAIHPDDMERVKEDTRTMFSTGKPVMRVYRMKHAITGEYVWLEDHVMPIADENGWIKEFYASARDITARRNAELEREKLITELSRRHDELMQFNHIVSHNLRSPVASILGLSQFIHNDMPREELEMTTSYLVQAAEAMDTLLHDLNVILSARSTIHEKIETFELSVVISSVQFQLKKELDVTGASIHISIEREAEQMTSIKSYIQSAIYNLVSNAIKYRSPSRALVINIAARREQEHLVISVSDNGMGMDLATHKERLFKLYSRLQTNIEGRGLGLFMTKTQLESLNGTLTVESEVDKGTTFTITL